MSQILSLLLFLCLLPPVVPLFCYTCVFPAISPLECIRYPTRCAPGQRCLSSRAVGRRGDFSVTLYEKSCVFSSLCGLTGQKFAMGLNFTFTNDCCDSTLCNGAGHGSAVWAGSVLTLLLSFSLSLW